MVLAHAHRDGDVARVPERRPIRQPGRDPLDEPGPAQFPWRLGHPGHDTLGTGDPAAQRGRHAHGHHRPRGWCHGGRFLVHRDMVPEVLRQLRDAPGEHRAVGDAGHAVRLDRQCGHDRREVERTPERQRPIPERAAGDAAEHPGRVDTIARAGRIHHALDRHRREPQEPQAVAGPRDVEGAVLRSRDRQLLARPRQEPIEAVAAGTEVLGAHRAQVAARQQWSWRRRQLHDRLPRVDPAEHALPRERDESVGSGHLGPVVRQLVGDGTEEECPGIAPIGRQGVGRDRIARLVADLLAAPRRLDVVEDRTVDQRHQAHVDAGRPQQVQLVTLGRRRRVHADQRTDPGPEPRREQRAVRHRATESPAARIRSVDVPRRRPDDDEARPGRRAVAHRCLPILSPCTSTSFTRPTTTC